MQPTTKTTRDKSEGSMKSVLAVLALATAMAVPSVASAGGHGLVFVHGTGDQTNAASSYWSQHNIDWTIPAAYKAGGAYAGNVLIVNCKFSKYMWDAEAAGCLTTQVTNFITSRGIDKFVFITHSNGGNVVRWIMSNPTYDSRYPALLAKLHYVYAIAPSSAGTALANAAVTGTAFESAVAWLLGYVGDAIKMQQTSWMTTYNANNLYGTTGRPALGTFWVIAGGGVNVSPTSASGTCGGFDLQMGLKTTNGWLSGSADGFLTVASQMAAGSFWFEDKTLTNNRWTLSHNQSRRGCHHLDVIIRADLDTFFP
jgi:hypothetical protein